MGRIYVIPHEVVNGQAQGGACALPIPAFPTGIMRGRFHPVDGQLYACGMFAWAGNQTRPGGFYRVRSTGKPVDLPVGLKARSGGVEITFTDPIAPSGVADPEHYEVRAWDLLRSKDYGSKHLNEHVVPVTGASLLPDGRTVRLDLADPSPTRGMSIAYRLKGVDGRAVVGTIHNTIHAFAGDSPKEKEKSDPPPAEPSKPTSRTDRVIEGWTVRVDDRLLRGPDEALGTRALRFLEAKLIDIEAVVPPDKLARLRSVPIVLDLSHGKLASMQYHPSAGWLESNGYSRDLARCVHLPRAADLATRRNIREQPWVILHELSHAYHDQVLGFDEPRIKAAYEAFKASGRGDKDPPA